MKTFEIKASVPVSAFSVDVLHIEAETKEEAIQKLKSKDFNEDESLCDSLDIEILESDYSGAEVLSIEEMDD